MEVFGDLKKLSPSEKNQLNKILDLRSRGENVIESSVAKKVSQLVDKLNLPVALLLTREGYIEFVILGTKQRLYLPDLGRFRLDELKLRKLRLVVFWPESSVNWENQFGVQKKIANQKELTNSLFPIINKDFITDLEKLRLDCLLLVSVVSGKSFTCSFAFYKIIQNSKYQAELKVSVDHYSDISEVDVDLTSHFAELEKFKRTKVPSSKIVQDKLAILVGVYSAKLEEIDYSIEELKELARTAGLIVADVFLQKRRYLDPRTVIGKGKIEELVLQALDLGADLLVFDCELTPSQLREITKITELRVIDRSMLILDIFSQRAKSSEGKLQVELAQLKYNLPRLADRDSGLSRLTGGVGGRGPGETKLEISRRRARDRITFLESRIEIISKQRNLRRSKRHDRGVPIIGIVGYTNAGKSTLLNALSKSDTFAEDKLFATLDTASRRMRFPNEKEVIFVDTVGFIRNLPKELMGAFRATLEEIDEADLLLHVVDAGGDEIRRHIEVVTLTLTELGYNEKPKLLVLNKCDLLSEPEKQSLENTLNGLCISAKTRMGVSDLINEVVTLMNRDLKLKDPGAFLEYPGS